MYNTLIRMLINTTMMPEAVSSLNEKHSISTWYARHVHHVPLGLF